MSFGDKWQNFLDKVDQRIPIKKITSKLDLKNKLVSFWIFVLIVLVILFFIFKPYILNPVPVYNDVTFKLADDTGMLLTNFSFDIKNINTGEETTYVSDSSGKKRVSLDTKKTYQVIVKSQGYKLFEKDIDPSLSEFKIILETLNLPTSFNKTLSFVDSSTTSLILEALDVTLRCENGETISPTNLVVDNGKYTFDVPSNCGAIIASVRGENYLTEGIIIPENQSVVKLDYIYLYVDTGSLKVTTIKNGSQSQFIDGITVSVYSSDDLLNPFKVKDTVWGVSEFDNLPTGSYRIVTSDSTNRYLSSSKDVVIEKDNLTKANLYLMDSQDPNSLVDPDTNLPVSTRLIEVTLKDKETLEIIEDLVYEPEIKLILDGNEAVQVKTDPTDFTFLIEEGKDYSIRGSALNYIPEIVEVDDSNNYIIKLEEVTVSNVSNINVNALDEDEIPVAFSKVLIYNAQTGYIDSRFDFLTTDSNGEVTFENIPEGDYFIKLKQLYLEGVSDNFTHIPPEDSNALVSVFIGEGTLRLNIFDSLGDPVSDATLDFYLDTGDLLGTDYSTQNGTYSKTIKADKRVYVKVSKEGYMPYFTEVVRVENDKIITKDIVLSSEYTGSTPLVDYLGVYDSTNQEVDALENNKIFYFKYRLTNPIASEKMGFVFKIGSENSSDDDIVFINPITNTLGVTTYFKEYPFTEIVASDMHAKLIDILWDDISPGVYELTVPIRTHDAAINEVVPVYFNSYSDNFEDYTNNSLYEYYQYYIDAEELCSSSFCFKGQYVDVLKDIRYDIGSNLDIPMQINSDYILEYYLTNSSSDDFDESRLLIFNSDLYNNPLEVVNIKNYEISGAFNDTGYLTPGEESFKIPFDEEELLTENISSYSETFFKNTLSPLYLGQSRLYHQIINDQQEIYSLGLNVLVGNLHNMQVNYSPVNIVPNKPFDLLITIKDQEENTFLSDVTVNIYYKVNGYEYPVVLDKSTNDLGEVLVSLAPLEIGEKLIIEANKATYFAERIEVSANKDILNILDGSVEITEEAPLEININKNEVNGTIKEIVIENLTEFDMTLNEFETEGIYFEESNYLAVEKTLEFLNTQISDGFIIPANSSRTLEVKMAPSLDAVSLFETKYLSGVLTGTTSIESSEYIFSVPIEVVISVGNGVLQDNCLTTSGHEKVWEGVIDGSKAQTISFIVQNNCKSYDNPDTFLSLRNLKFKIVNTEDKTGYYDVSLNGQTTRLSEGIYKKVYDTIEPETDYMVTVTFNSGVLKFGDIETDLYINGQVETEDGLEYVNNGDTEQFLDAEFSIVNIDECFEFEQNGKTINQNGMFVIDSETIIGSSQEVTVRNKCSNNGKFKLTFCDDKANHFSCQDLEYGNLSGNYNNEIVFSVGDQEKIIDIYKPEVPGAYTINVLIEAMNQNDRVLSRVTKNLRVNVKDQLWMENPFLEVLDDDRVYNAKLYNKNISKTPWDYAKQKVEGHDGFSKFMSDDFENNDGTIYTKAKFSDSGNLENGTPIGGSSGYDEFFAKLHSNLGVGYYLSGIFPLIEIIHNAVASDSTPYAWDYSLDVGNILNEDETTKIQVIENQDVESMYLDVFDITGARHFSYLSQKIEAFGNLAKDEDIINSLDACSLKNSNFELYEDDLYNGLYGKILTTSTNCSPLEISNNNSRYDFKTTCTGSAVFRQELDLEYITIATCKENQTVWPEQSGIKPIEFVLTSDFLNAFNNSSTQNIFKEYNIYPTYNDTVDIVDPAFDGSSKIGKFRFEFHKLNVNEQPNVDLELTSCYTDTDKQGYTGEGIVPNVSLDWSWQDTEINKCSETYCDGAQLSIEIVNRLKLIKDFLESQEGISCPLSEEQILASALDGSYGYSAEPSIIENEINYNSVGIKRGIFAFDNENNFNIKTYIKNRTLETKQGSLDFSFGSYLPDHVFVYSYSSSVPEEIDVSSNGVYDLQIDADDTLIVTMVYDSSNLFEQEDISLEINYSGESVDPINNNFNSIVDLFIYDSASSSQSCLVPSTTKVINNIDFIDYWFNADMYPEQVMTNGGFGFTSEDISYLKGLISFDAYLITDNYNQNLKNDFDLAYCGQASFEDGLSCGPYSLGASVVSDYTNGILSNVYRDNLEFTLKHSYQDEVSINTPGKYRVRIDLDFDNEFWNFEQNNQVDVNSVVTFDYVPVSSENNSVFYRLPFDGFLGFTENGYNRQGYGLSYFGDEILISQDADNSISTSNDTSSNAFGVLNILKENDFFKINSNVNSRGNLLNIEYDSDQTQLVFSPSNATPVLMSVAIDRLEPFTIFYKLLDVTDSVLGDVVYGNSNLFRWSGVGDGCDFSGDYIYSTFNNTFDDMSLPEDGINNSYKLSWTQNPSKIGKIYLRTIVYTPLDRLFEIKDKSGNSADVTFNVYDLPEGVIEIESLKQLFSYILENKVCVTNSEDGLKSEFWWNPSEVYGQDNVFTQNYPDSLQCS